MALLISNAIGPEIEILVIGRLHVDNCHPSKVFFLNNCRVKLALTLPYEVGIYLNFFSVKSVYSKGGSSSELSSELKLKFTGLLPLTGLDLLAGLALEVEGIAGGG